MLEHVMGFPGGSEVKNLPAMQETQVQSLFREDILEKKMTTHSSILTCEIPWTEEPGGLQSTGWQRYNSVTKRQRIEEWWNYVFSMVSGYILKTQKLWVLFVPDLGKT